MRPVTESLHIEGPAGALEAVLAAPAAGATGIAVVAHPNPVQGGTMDNKVVHTLVRAFLELGLAAVRFNFRGVGASHGHFDHGFGETDDVCAVAAHARERFGDLPLTLAGFSFGGFVQSRASRSLHPHRLVLIAPAVGRFDVPTVPENTLVIHGELDDVVPLKDIFDWARPQHLPIVVIPGGEHFFHGRLNILRHLVVNACRS